MTENTADTAGQVREEIERTRDDLAETVDALQDKLNVKARAKTKAHDVTAGVNAKANHLKQQAPPPVRDLLDRGATALAPAAAKARPYRSQIAVGAGAIGLGLVLVAMRRRSR